MATKAVIYSTIRPYEFRDGVANSGPAGTDGRWYLDSDGREMTNKVELTLSSYEKFEFEIDYSANTTYTPLTGANYLPDWAWIKMETTPDADPGIPLSQYAVKCEMSDFQAPAGVMDTTLVMMPGESNFFPLSAGNGTGPGASGHCLDADEWEFKQTWALNGSYAIDSNNIRPPKKATVRIILMRE